MSYLRIGDVSRLTETNNETLRFYETKGLLAASRRSDAGYRLYTDDAVARVKFILRAKRMGFSLKEVSELLELRTDRDDRTCGDVKVLAEEKLLDINKKLDELTKMKLALQEITDACCGGDESAVFCSILNGLDDQA